MSDDAERSLADYNRMHSREEVIELPHMMVLLGYLALQHNVPRYGWKKHGLRYHYTDAPGLLGIIQSGRLWATDLRYLNDPSEGYFLPDRLLALMASKVGGLSGTEQKIIEGLKTALRNPRRKFNDFCVSLSADGDLLSQWRGYGGFGKGYAVGLNLQHMPHPQIASYFDIIYGEEGLADLAHDLLDLFVSAESKWKDEMLDQWATTINAIASSFKHESYVEEQESRLLCSISGRDQILEDELPLNFRARGSDIIPYIPMSLHFLRDKIEPRLPIEHIVVGPGVDFERNCASITSLLKANSYHNVKVEPSIIPFRP